MSLHSFRLRGKVPRALLLCAFATCSVPAEDAAPASQPWEIYTEWPFDADEAKRRQDETASAMQIPVLRSIDLGGGIRIEFVLIPAGAFTMGTPDPPPPKETPVVGQALLFWSGVCLVAFFIFLFGRAEKRGRPPQFSLRAGLVVMAFASLAVWGGVRWRVAVEEQREFSAAKARHQAAREDERPAHQVVISRPFYIGAFEVTQTQWQAVRPHPGAVAARRPVSGVSWEKVKSFCREMSEAEDVRDQLSRIAKGYEAVVRLPTEAEWEYAARAGTRTLYYSGDTRADLKRVGWFDGGGVHLIGKKPPNAFGLYDMHGNVSEWCEDWYAGSYYEKCPRVDPKGPSSGQLRVLRGGGAMYGPGFCRSARRMWDSPGFSSSNSGFRIILDFQPRPKKNERKADQ